jgi:hypothetical protein
MSDNNGKNDYQESVSGFKIIGDWSNIVEHGERISYTLERIGIQDYESELNEYNEWRPKTAENSSDISERTADSASIDTSEDKEPKDEINIAKQKASDSVSEIGDIDTSNAYNDSAESAKHTLNAIKSVTKETFRKSEEMVYENIMTKMSPYYFDNSLISANISKKSENKFSFEININVDELKQKMSNNLQDVYNNVDRKEITRQLDSVELDNTSHEESKNHVAAELKSDSSNIED